MTVEHRVGPAATQAAWADVFAGAVAPSVGLVAVVAEPGTST